MASRVEKRTARALLFFKMDRFAMVMSTFWASSPRDIFRLAIITSRFTTIPMFSPPPQMVKSWSSWSSAAWRNRADMTRNSRPPIKKMGTAAAL